MNRLLKRKYKKVGMPPGSLVYIGEEGKEPPKVKLSVVEYDTTNFLEKQDVSIQECLEHLQTPSMTWIQLFGVSDTSAVSAIGNHFKLHPLVLEDILNTGQRSKLDAYDDSNQIFIVVRLLHIDEKTHELKDEQLSLVIGPNYLISFSERNKDIFAPVMQRLRQPGNRIRKEGPDYLAYAIIDMIVDQYFLVLEQMDNLLEGLEDDLIKQPKPKTLMKIQQTKRDMIVLRRTIWPMREVVSRFQQIDSPLVKHDTQFYLKDVYDHVVHIIDIIEGLRDVAGGLLDIYMSSINIRTNDIMKVLTIVSTIFVPLTFISSLYGMNFLFMPELQQPWAYPAVLLLMLSIAVGMLIFFRRKHWI